MPDLQKLGDCCRRLLGSLDVDVQVSVCTSRCWLVESSECARMVKCLAPHLNGMSQDVNWSPEPEGFMLSDLLPADSIWQSCLAPLLFKVCRLL